MSANEKPAKLLFLRQFNWFVCCCFVMFCARYFPIQYLKVLAFTIVAEDWATNSHQNGLNINKYRTNIDKIFKICLLLNIILLNCF